MATAGELLRAARQAAGLTLQQVADATKMRADRVQAVEEGNYQVFSAPVYVRGFVRTYARLVHADEAAVLAALESELARCKHLREPPSLTGQESTPLDRWMLRLSRIPWKVVLPVTAIVLVVVVATWIYQARERALVRDPLSGIPPAVYQPPDAGGDTLPLPAPPGR